MSLAFRALLIVSLGFAVAAGAQDRSFGFPGEGESGWAITGAELSGGGSAEPLVQRGPGCISGTVVDADQAAVPGATVVLLGENGRPGLRAESASDGSFVLPGVPAGVYLVRVERQGFVPFTVTASVDPGQQMQMGQLLLGVAASDSVEVRASARDIAEAQLGLQEKQRVLGVFPNFYASYVSDAQPLSAGEKYRLAWRLSVDPTVFAVAVVMAGSEQRAGTFPGYGHGRDGFARRFGAAYGDGLTSTFLGQAIFPALLHQDPRYFIKGTGSVASRALYAIATTVMCKGDSRHWQVNYSNVLGNLASAGISNAYYPAGSRGFGLVVQNGLTATAMGAIGGLFQEFLLHRMTPHVPDYRDVREAGGASDVAAGRVAE